MMIHNTRSVVVLSALSVVAAATSVAPASISFVTGNALLISPPPSCIFGAQSGFTAFAWNEQTSVALSAQAVDMVNNPGISTGAIAGALSGTFDSHFIHYEGIPGVINATGTVVFSSQIIGVIFNKPLLDATDVSLGALGTIYPTGYAFRGLNTSPPSIFSINNNVLSFNFLNFFPNMQVVQVRVLTLVPAPGATLALGAAGILALRRRRI